MNTRVSIVMPIYNSERYLKDAIDSIIAQTYTHFELILVNDGSTDNSINIINVYLAKDPRIRMIDNIKNLGIAKSRNKGISVAKGYYIANMDSDDIAYTDRIQKQVDYLDNNPRIDICIGHMDVMDESGRFLYSRKFPLTNLAIKQAFYRYNPIPNPAVMYKKIVWEKVGGYDDLYKYSADDLDFWFKAMNSFEAGNINCSILKYKLRYSSITHNNFAKVEREAFKIRFKYLTKYKIKPRFVDIFFNIAELIAHYTIPTSIRLAVYEYIRKKELI